MPDDHGTHFEGGYDYFYSTLKESEFANVYLYKEIDSLTGYLSDPNNKCLNFIKEITSKNNKQLMVARALSNLNEEEEILGKLQDHSHRKHLVHSVNVFLLGLCLYEDHPSLARLLSIYPGEKIVNEQSISEEDIKRRYGVFVFRWLYACLFHDAGYGYELIANTTDDKIVDIYPVGSEIFNVFSLPSCTIDMDKLLKDRQNQIREIVFRHKNIKILPRIKNSDYDINSDLYPYYYESSSRKTTHRAINKTTLILFIDFLF